MCIRDRCLDDIDYQQFRRVVRDPAWQQAVLARSLAQRRALAREIRQHGTRSAGADPAGYADVDADAARAWLTAARATTLIHGHTHRPGDHDLGAPNLPAPAPPGTARLQRVVLSDWDAAATPARAQVLRLSAAGLQRIHLA